MPGPLPFVPNAAKVTVVGVESTVGRTVISSLHYQWGSGVADDTDLNALAQQVWTVYNTVWVQSGFASPNYTLQEVEALYLGDASGLAGSYAATRAGQGSQPYDVAACGVLSFKISRRYRGGKPKMFIAGLSAAAVNQDNALTSSAAAALTTMGGELIDSTGPVISHSYPHIGLLNCVNISYFHGFTPTTYPSGRVKNVPNRRPVPLVDLINGAQGETILGSQRRRRFAG